MTPTRLDPAVAYRLMVRMRLVEAMLTRSWADGLVPGEYHSGIGEEAINAGVLMHLTSDDALALDHRNTGAFIGRGTDPEALMREVLGSETGMNHGMAGHMHLIDPDVRASADGIVGASAPVAVGQALAALMRRPGSVAVALHGEAAMNQGMLLEAYNLAVAWHLPVVFVCRDNRWSITTHTADVTGGSLAARAKAFGLTVRKVRGHRVQDVHAAAGELIDRARNGKGPGLLYATCHRPGGHFEGDAIVRLMHHPREQARTLAPELAAGLSASTDPWVRGRLRGLAAISAWGARVVRDWTIHSPDDPLRHARALLPEAEGRRIREQETATIRAAAKAARADVSDRPVFGRRASR